VQDVLYGDERDDLLSESCASQDDLVGDRGIVRGGRDSEGGADLWCGSGRGVGLAGRGIQAQ